MSPVTEQDLAHELRRQAEHVGGTPLQLADVRASAGRIRLRRRLAPGGNATRPGWDRVLGKSCGKDGDQVELAAETGTGVAVQDKDAEFAAYMAARQPALLRTAYLLTGDQHTAEDLVQTALAKLYLSWDKVHRREVVDGYVRRILVNENNSLWRRAWKRREVATDVVPDNRTVVDRTDDGQSAALWDFVQTLPRKQRAVIVLRYYEDLSEAETADILGISVGTVKSQASRALAAMRSRVQDNPLLARETGDHKEDR